MAVRKRQKHGMNSEARFPWFDGKIVKTTAWSDAVVTTSITKVSISNREDMDRIGIEHVTG